MTDKKYKKLLQDDNVSLDDLINKCQEENYSSVEYVVSQEQVRERIASQLLEGYFVKSFVETLEADTFYDWWYWCDLRLEPIKSKEDFDSFM